MAKDDPFAGAAFSATFATLRALRLLFVAFKNSVSVSRHAGRGEGEGGDTFKLSSPTCQAGLGQSRRLQVRRGDLHTIQFWIAYRARAL